MRMQAAENPDTSSRFGYVLRVPIEGQSDLLLKTTRLWPAGTPLYCHAIEHWPDAPELLLDECVAQSVRVAEMVIVVLGDGRKAYFNFGADKKGRLRIFWLSQRLYRQRPTKRKAPARTSGTSERLSVLVDSREQHPWTFVGLPVTTSQVTLRVGDYATAVNGSTVGLVERKSAEDFVRSLNDGRLERQVARLQTVSALAAVVVEASYLDLTEGPAGLADRYVQFQQITPVPLLLGGNRQAAQDLAYRWLARTTMAVD